MVLSSVVSGDEGSLRAAVGLEASELSGFIPCPSEAESTWQWLADAIDSDRCGESITLAVRQAPDRITGICRLAAFDYPRGRVQISFWVSTPCRRQGCATMAVRFALRLAADQLGISSVVTAVKEENLASRSVLSRNGFRLSIPPRSGSGWDGILHGEAAVCPSDSDVWPWRAGQDHQICQLEGDSSVMLIIRNDQMDVFRRMRLGAFARQVAVDTVRQHPYLFDRDQDPRDLEETIYRAIERAWGYGLRQDRHLQAFGELAVIAGPMFDAYPPFHDLLTQRRLDPGRRFELLFKIARQEDWIIAARLEPEDGDA